MALNVPAFSQNQAQMLPDIAQQHLQSGRTIPQAGTFEIPNTSISAGEMVGLTFTASNNLTDVKLTFKEAGHDADPQINVVRNLPNMSAGQTWSEQARLPRQLFKSIGNRLARRIESIILPESRNFSITIEGTNEEGRLARTQRSIMFESEGNGQYKAWWQADYDQIHGLEPQSLYTVSAENIPTSLGIASEAGYKDHPRLVMDPEGNKTEYVEESSISISGTEVNVTVSGYILYRDVSGNIVPLPNAKITVWEQNTSTGNAFTEPDWTTYTSSTGYYSRTIGYNDGGNSLELFVEIETDNSWVRMGQYTGSSTYLNCSLVSNNYCGLSDVNNIKRWQSPVQTGVTGGNLTASYSILNTSAAPAHIFNLLHDAAAFTRTSYNPGKAIAVHGFAAGGAYSMPGYGHNLIFSNLMGDPSGYAIVHDVVYHEYGHLTMYRRNAYASSHIGGPHYINTLIHPDFAWSEGWPTAYAQMINPDGYYDSQVTFPGKRFPLEFSSNQLPAMYNGSYHWTANEPNLHNEMLVAAAVIDFYDVGAGDQDNDLAQGLFTFHEMMEMIRTNNIDNMTEFYNIVLSSIYQDEKYNASKVMQQNKFGYVSTIPKLAAVLSGTTNLASPDVGSWSTTALGAQAGSYTYKRYISASGDPFSLVRNVTKSSITDSFSHFLLERENQIKLVVTQNGETVTSYQTVWVCEGFQCLSGGEVGETLSTQTPTETTLNNYPNPFNPSTEIQFSLVSQVQVSLIVYDMLGREVITLLNNVMKPGYHSARFDASHLPSGLYIYRLQAGTTSITKQMLLVK